MNLTLATPNSLKPNCRTVQMMAAVRAPASIPAEPPEPRARVEEGDARKKSKRYVRRQAFMIPPVTAPLIAVSGTSCIRICDHEGCEEVLELGSGGCSEGRRRGRTATSRMPKWTVSPRQIAHPLIRSEPRTEEECSRYSSIHSCRQRERRWVPRTSVESMDCSERSRRDGCSRSGGLR